MGRKERFSGHGSMTKAGKVRLTTPVFNKYGVNSQKKKIPRLRYKQLYEDRFIEKKFGGQKNSFNAKRMKKK